MSNPARSDSVESGDGFRKANEVAVKMLDLSINAKTNLMRCVVEAGEEDSEEKTVFCSVYDYLHHAHWRVFIPEEIRDSEMKAIEHVRGNPTIISQIIESCKGSVVKEVDLIHQLNCELFFQKLDKAKFSFAPVYLYYNAANDFHQAIVKEDFSIAKELPETLKQDMDKHIETRTMWAKRKNPAAKCVVLAVLQYDAMPKEIVTFHSRVA